MTSSAPRPVSVLIAALGGQGGGVLTDWIVAAAEHAGLAAQATSIPGVAQRTGATTYYLEVHPVAAGPGACIVLTGDLANELLADYTPISYAGREFYPLPDLETGRLRQTLVRGLDAGDREVGVFARHGLDVIQPYALVADEYLGLPGSLLGRDGFKQALSREIAGDLLPEFIFQRRKVRAQIGNAQASGGILPLLVDRGVDAACLRRNFCRIFSVRDDGCLDRFIRAGRYRAMGTASAGRHSIAT